MKKARILVLFPLFLIGVFGVEVSVKEGESITLHTELTEIQKGDGIEWRLNGTRIAKISMSSRGLSVWISADGADRLQQDNQTGDLKITDIKATDSGEYKLKITSTRGSSEKIFRVNGVPVPVDEGKVVSVMEGYSVTLKTAVTEIQTDDAIRWRFGHQNSSIAEIKREARNISTHDGRFRDRLNLDYLTGSLTIRNITTNHSGLYEVDISSGGYTIHKSFSVTVRDGLKPVSMKEGDSITLNTDLTEIKTDEVILWKFEDTHIAKISKANKQFHTSEGPDGSFKDRLKLDNQTGSLTITDTRFTDSGKYEVTISTSRYTVFKIITVTVNGPDSGPDSGSDSGSGLSAGTVVGIIVAALLIFAAVAGAVIYYFRRNSERQRQMPKTLAVIEGESVFLIPDDGINMQKDDIQWKYEDSIIAERRGSNGESTLHEDVLDKKFKGRLFLEKSNGSLKIEDARFTDSGRYELRIIRSGHESVQTFIVSVCDPKNPEEMLLKGLSAQYQ